jgi:hypothetical protein
MTEPRDEVGFDPLTRSFYCLVCKRQRDDIAAVKQCCADHKNKPASVQGVQYEE